MTNLLTRTLAHDECKRLDDAEKQPVKGWRNLYFATDGMCEYGKAGPYRTKEMAERIAYELCNFTPGKPYHPSFKVIGGKIASHFIPMPVGAA